MSDSGSSSGDERRVVEVSASTVDEAIARGLVRLGGLSRNEVKIEVLSEGRAGLLGFGVEEARVKLSTLLAGEQAEAPPSAARPEKPAPKPAAPKAEPTSPAREPKPQPKPTPKPPVQAEKPQPKPARQAVQRPAVSAGEASKTAQEIVETLLTHMGFEEVGTELKGSLLPVDVEGEDSLVLSIHGPGTDRLTHKDGRSLQALQFVSRLVLSRRMGQWQNLLLDVDDDRARRIKEIYMMAEQSAELVEREGRPVSLPPMTAYERRVVHLALREHESIATQSIGQGHGRKVTVRRKDDLLPEL
jgi:spoIIIJ-associated protein